MNEYLEASGPCLHLNSPLSLFQERPSFLKAPRSPSCGGIGPVVSYITLRVVADNRHRLRPKKVHSACIYGDMSILPSVVAVLCCVRDTSLGRLDNHHYYRPLMCCVANKSMRLVYLA